MKHLLIVLFAGLLLVGCSSQGTNPVEEPDDTPVSPDLTIPDVSDLSTWEGFWGEFQHAVAANDKAKVESLTAFGNNLEKKDFEDGYEMFFGDELKGVIAKTTAADVEANEDGAIEVEDPRVVAWEETAIVDGEEMGSALILYFGKVSGEYRMVFWMAAG